MQFDISSKEAVTHILYIIIIIIIIITICVHRYTNYARVHLRTRQPIIGNV